MSTSTGRGDATLSDMKRRRKGSKNDINKDTNEFGEKLASDTATEGIKTFDAEVKHYDADGTSITPLPVLPHS